MMQNRIRTLREEKKMTQLRLSIELGVTQETVSAYENGKHQPSVATLLRMSELFHASLDYILGRSDLRLPTRQDSLPPDEGELLALYRSLTPVQRERVTAFIEGMLG